MARNFILANSEDIRFPSIAAALDASANHTALCKVRVPAVVATQRIVYSVSSTTTSNLFYILLTVQADGQIRSFIQSNSNSALDLSVTLITANAWHTVGHVRTGNLVQTVLDSLITTGTTSAGFGTWPTIDTLDVAAFVNGSTTRGTFLDGDAAEFAFWDTNLTDEEVAAYHAGASPLSIRPQNLIFYAPLYGTTLEPDLSGSGNLGTLTNTPLPTGDHPPRQRFSPSIYSALYNTPPFGITVPRGILTLTGFAPTIPIVTVPAGVLTLTGFAPVITEGIAVSIPRGILTLTGFAPIPSESILEFIMEAFNGSETVVNSQFFSSTLTDIIRASDDVKPGWKAIINENFDLSETILVDWIVSIMEELFTSDSVIVGGQYSTLLADILSQQDLVSAWKVFNDILLENFDLSENIIDIHKKIAIILEILELRETVLNTGTFQAFLADTLNLSEVLEKIFQELISDALNLSDIIIDKGIFLTPITEAFTVADVVAELFTASTTVVDTFQAVDGDVVQGTYFVLSNDQVIFNSEIMVSGQVFACWVLTTKQYNPSIYSNFDFNSYARLANKLYGARSDGIYLLEGADDAGSVVHTGLLFDFANMDIPETKRLRSIHLGSKTTQATIQVATDRGINRTYTTKHQRAVIGKEVRGKYWTVAVEDVENLKSMELNVVLLSKSR